MSDSKTGSKGSQSGEAVKDGPTLLTRDQILAIDDIVYEIVDVPEWNGKVRVKRLTGRQRDAFESSMVLGRGTKKQKFTFENMRAKLVALCCVDKDGHRMFRDDKDVLMLGGKGSSAIAKLYDVCARLNGITDEDIEELVGNSENDLFASSS